MKIIIAGGTGFLGSALGQALGDQHEVVVLTRRSGQTSHRRLVAWAPTGGTGPWASEIDGADAVVNLAGESIAKRRWSERQKRRILDSRVDATRSLVAAIAAAAHPPAVFVSGSAVGYYGPLGDEIATETTRAGSDFLADVCVRWEDEASRASSAATRVVCIRTGLVLDRSGGALPQMLAPFRIGAGGPVGSGTQYWPWIHLHDWVELVQWTILSADLTGPINATAPNPVVNREFARTLARVLHRPAVLVAPAFALRLLMGEMADSLLLSGQRAVPAKAQRLGFAFQYLQLEEALRAIFSAPKRD